MAKIREDDGIEGLVQDILSAANHIEENAPGPYGYEKISPLAGKPHFRIYDANDDRIATCHWEGHAKLIVRLMNRP